MKKLFAACAVTAVVTGLAVALVAQQTRREEVRSSGAPEDARANSSKVPDVYAMNGKFDRISILRFKYDTDLLAGMEKMVKEQKIKNGVILSALGSVRNYQVHVVSNRTFPSKDMFTKEASAPADILGMNGYIIDGVIHAHMTLANPEKAFGGHLEPGTNVFTFAAVTIGVLADGIDISRLDDKTNR